MGGIKAGGRKPSPLFRFEVLDVKSGFLLLTIATWCKNSYEKVVIYKPIVTLWSKHSSLAACSKLFVANWYSHHIFYDVLNECLVMHLNKLVRYCHHVCLLYLSGCYNQGIFGAVGLFYSLKGSEISLGLT